MVIIIGVLVNVHTIVFSPKEKVKAWFAYLSISVVQPCPRGWSEANMTSPKKDLGSKIHIWAGVHCLELVRASSRTPLIVINVIHVRLGQWDRSKEPLWAENNHLGIWEGVLTWLPNPDHLTDSSLGMITCIFTEELTHGYRVVIIIRRTTKKNSTVLWGVWLRPALFWSLSWRDWIFCSAVLVRRVALAVSAQAYLRGVVGSVPAHHN